MKFHDLRDGSESCASFRSHFIVDLIALKLCHDNRGRIQSFFLFHGWNINMVLKKFAYQKCYGSK